MTLGIVLLQGPRRGMFRMSEVPLYVRFIKSPPAPTQLSNWSRYPPEYGRNATFVVHCVRGARLSALLSTSEEKGGREVITTEFV